MKKIILILFAIMPFYGFTQSKLIHPPVVEKVLKLAGPNRAELEKAINFFRKQNDPEKLKAINFLVSNMDIHFSANYYWADTAGKPVAYNELSYPDFETAIKAFDELKEKTIGIHPVSYTVRDIDSIKADYLIANTEHAFKAWRNGVYKKISFDDFCEYILPYRTSIEPLQNWREAYRDKFAWMGDTARVSGVEKAISYFSTESKNWFMNTYNQETRSEPLPRLGAMQILLRKKGACEDMVDLVAFALRSQGFPASVNFIPYWATSTGRHFVNGVFNLKMDGMKLDMLATPPLNSDLIREPAKVLVGTYAKQPDALAMQEEQNNIPAGFLRTYNYKDVTSDYWQTSDVKSKLQPTSSKQKFAYLCVFNGLGWKPAWWGKVTADSVVFKNMSKGAVYLPVWYIDGKLVPAAHPVALGYNHEMVLAPDTLKKRKVTIEEQDKYLIFQPGKKYNLLYWDRNWKSLAIKTISDGEHSIEFDNVPENALLLLVPEYTKGKERPFMIDEGGKRIWW